MNVLTTFWFTGKQCDINSKVDCPMKFVSTWWD